MPWLKLQMMVQVDDHPDLNRSSYFNREPILCTAVSTDLKRKILAAIKREDYRFGAIQVIEP
jgi:hypothetical protein